MEAVFLTEADIAGGKSRTTSASLLRDCWIKASEELGITLLHDKMAEYQELDEDQLNCSLSILENKTILAVKASFLSSMKVADQIFRGRTGNGLGIIVVTGSLHIVSSVLAALHG